MLLDHGAQPNAKETLRGTTAAMWAAEQGHADVAATAGRTRRRSRAQSAVLHPSKRRGLGLRRRRCSRSRPGAPERRPDAAALRRPRRRDGLRAVPRQIRRVDVNQTSVDGSSPLLVAVQNGYYDIATYLMDHGANPNLANTKGWTPALSRGEKPQSGNHRYPRPRARWRARFIKTLLDHGAESQRSGSRPIPKSTRA